MDNSSADSPTTTEDFIAKLGDADEGVRICAALRLGRLGRADHAAVPALVGLLRRGTVTDRRVAALALGKIGPPAREAVPVLLEEMGRTCDGQGDDTSTKWFFWFQRLTMSRDGID